MITIEKTKYYGIYEAWRGTKRIFLTKNLTPGKNFFHESLYQQQNEEWDLVDLTSGQMIDFLKVDKEFLPEELKEDDSAKLESLLIGKKKERKDAIALILLLSQRRLEYLKALKKETEEKIKVDNSLAGILMKTTSHQANEWGFSRTY